ncbi:hypothetical protein [Clostridium botulinum]|uniref:hypothetical protein n=1 Tax=Clostridium botulinum TaxID=1491 RepID=UPI0005861266|nr:hypothetical protein [Clostridium botulinum]AJD27943.1 hypothetical protein T257_3363 [Clostridium botulinum CDC_297]
MARQKNEIDIEEIDEIIYLKLNELGGLKSRLSYNNVWTYNKKLVKNNVLRSNGKPFKLYGYTFWAYNYNDEDYYGKAKIDEIKSNEDIVLAGKSFNRGIQDLLMMVDKYHNKPQELSKRLVKFFENDKKKIDQLSEQNKLLNKTIVELRKQLNNFEQGFATVFYNSIYTDNSLNDVMSIKRSGDCFVSDELKAMFNDDEKKLAKILQKEKRESYHMKDNVSNIDQKLKAKKKLEEIL